jgi:hypothetical protein
MNFVKGITFLFLLSTLFIGVSTKGFTQGNLQFNQVYSYSGFLSQGASSPVWTVPVGKVWKVDFFTTDWIVLNNNRGSNTNNNGGALWLRPGDLIYYSGPAYGVCCGGNTHYLISIIEFNVIP